MTRGRSTRRGEATGRLVMMVGRRQPDVNVAPPPAFARRSEERSFQQLGRGPCPLVVLIRRAGEGKSVASPTQSRGPSCSCARATPRRWTAACGGSACGCQLDRSSLRRCIHAARQRRKKGQTRPGLSPAFSSASARRALASTDTTKPVPRRPGYQLAPRRRSACSARPSSAEHGRRAGRPPPEAAWQRNMQHDVPSL